MTQVQIRAIRNGPLEVAGAVQVTDATGSARSCDEDPIYLCRCGHSANKPFCDGSHKRVGFQG